MLLEECASRTTWVALTLNYNNWSHCTLCTVAKSEGYEKQQQLAAASHGLTHIALMLPFLAP